MSSTSFSTCPSSTRNRLRKKDAISDVVEEKWVVRFRRCRSTEIAWYRRNPQNHSGAAAVQQLSRLAVILLSRLGPSFPGQLAESHDHRLYHVAIAVINGSSSCALYCSNRISSSSTCNSSSALHGFVI